MPVISSLGGDDSTVLPYCTVATRQKEKKSHFPMATSLLIMFLSVNVLARLLNETLPGSGPQVGSKPRWTEMATIKHVT